MLATGCGGSGEDCEALEVDRLRDSLQETNDEHANNSIEFNGICKLFYVQCNHAQIKERFISISQDLFCAGAVSRDLHRRLPAQSRYLYQSCRA